MHCAGYVNSRDFSMQILLVMVFFSLRDTRKHIENHVTTATMQHTTHKLLMMLQNVKNIMHVIMLLLSSFSSKGVRDYLACADLQLLLKLAVTAMV